jgi:hypothetical protein
MVGDITIWYQRKGFNDEPECAMSVEVEARVWKKLLSKWTKLKFRPKVSSTNCVKRNQFRTLECF